MRFIGRPALGAGYDDFVSQLLGATVNAGRVALSVQAVLGAYRRDVEWNPHFWYDTPRVPRVAAAIEAALACLLRGSRPAAVLPSALSSIVTARCAAATSSAPFHRLDR